MSDIKCDFGTVSERDMDLLFLNAFGNDKAFLKLFLDKTDLPSADYAVTEIYLSKADKDGESDITVIIERNITKLSSMRKHSLRLWFRIEPWQVSLITTM